jgi:type IV pilus assembly protein PilA
MISSVIERLGDRRDAAADAGEDAGFTLIELMVVLLIMAILLAIAIPTFLGVSGSANDRAAQSNLNTALTNAKSYFQSNSQSFAAATTAIGVLSTQEPSIQWTTGASGTSSQISVYTDATTGNGVILASLSKTGVCWYLVDNEANEASTTDTTYKNVPSAELQPGTWYGGAPNMTKTTCTAAFPATAPTGLVWSPAGTAGFPGGLP